MQFHERVKTISPKAMNLHLFVRLNEFRAAKSKEEVDVAYRRWKKEKDKQREEKLKLELKEQEKKFDVEKQKEEKKAMAERVGRKYIINTIHGTDIFKN